MKIVILDGFTANPGDLSWKGLEELGMLTVYDRTKPEETIARAAEADIVLTNKVIINREVMAQLPQLKYIGVLATGYNVVDIEAAHERGIIVTNVPAYSTESVAQMVFAHLLTVTNRTEHYAIQNRQGRWSKNPDFCYWDFPHRTTCRRDRPCLWYAGKSADQQVSRHPSRWHRESRSGSTLGDIGCHLTALSTHRHHPSPD